MIIAPEHLQEKSILSLLNFSDLFYGYSDKSAISTLGRSLHGLQMSYDPSKEA
jgi:hypothetical protein